MSNDDEFINSVSDNGSYDPDSFYVASRNAKGFKTTFTLSITPEVAAGIGEVIASRVLPHYRTPGDFYRNAIVHQLHKDRDRVGDPALVIVIDDLIESLIIESAAEKIKTIANAEQFAVDTAQEVSRLTMNDRTRRRIAPHVNQMLGAMQDENAKNQVRRALDIPT